MASQFYGKLLPDYGDLDNETGTAPGYQVYVEENDGGVSLQMLHAEKDTEGGSAVFFNVAETKEFILALQEALDRAEPKNANHKLRGKSC